MLVDLRQDKEEKVWRSVSQMLADLHEEAAGRRHRPLFSPARTLKWITEGALPQHSSDQNLKHSQTTEVLSEPTTCTMKCL